jgi:aprataxin
MDSIEALICQAPDTARRQVLKALRKMGDDVADMIKDEMVKSEGFEWGVEMGFHIIPSISCVCVWYQAAGIQVHVDHDGRS